MCIYILKYLLNGRLGLKKTTRDDKARKIIQQCGVTQVWKDRFRVQSQSKNMFYYVMRVNNRLICSCPDHKFRQIICKHIRAVYLFTNMVPVRQVKTSVVITPVKTSDCIFCHSDAIKKFGIRHNKSGDIQRYLCSNCDRTFSVNVGFERMKNNPQGITLALHLYFSGESLRKVANTLKLFGMDVSNQTVYNWIKKYIILMQAYVDDITPQVSDTWRSDEIYLRIKGRSKYLFAMMDDETRFWISRLVADSKNTHDVRPMYREAQRLAKKKPQVLITDGAFNFQQAYTKEWFTKKNPRTKHIRHISFKGDHNNNKMERFNGEIRDREKVMRGLKKKNTPILNGLQLFHNYMRSHAGLDGKTPAQASGIEVEGNNKWVTLIQNASKKQTKLNDYA